MIYYCENCKFMFERISEIEQCPDCEKPTIAKADEQQQQEYLACKKESL